MSEIPYKIKRMLISYLEDVNRIFPVYKAFLFGSYANGITHPGSDIDLAIFSQEITNENRSYYIKELLKIVFKYKADIQPLVYSVEDFITEDNDFIRIEIKENGKEIKG